MSEGRPLPISSGAELAAALAGRLRPGTVTVVLFGHAPGCRRPDGGECTCDPDVIVGGPELLAPADPPEATC